MSKPTSKPQSRPTATADAPRASRVAARGRVGQARTSGAAAAARTGAAPHGTQSWLAVVRAYNLCDAVMSTRLAGLGVRVAEHEMLANLASAPGITQQALAQRCFFAKSGISMLLAQMEQQGLVRREADAADARAKRLFLTEAGAALAAQTLHVQAEVVGTMARAVSEAELATVTDVMQRVSASLEALRANAAPAGKTARRSRRAGPAPPRP